MIGSENHQFQPYRSHISFSLMIRLLSCRCDIINEAIKRTVISKNKNHELVPVSHGFTSQRTESQRWSNIRRRHLNTCLLSHVVKTQKTKRPVKKLILRLFYNQYFLIQSNRSIWRVRDVLSRLVWVDQQLKAHRFWSWDWNWRNLKKNLVFDKLALFPADQWKLVSMWTKRVKVTSDGETHQVLLWVLSVTHHWVCHCRNVQDGLTGRKIDTCMCSILRAAPQACWNSLMESDGSVSLKLHTNCAAQLSVNHVWVFTSRAAQTHTRSPAAAAGLTIWTRSDGRTSFTTSPRRQPRAGRAGLQPERAALARCGVMRV